MQKKLLLGVLIPFIGTTAGAACVFPMKKEMGERLQRILTGFAAGAMIYVVVEELIPEMMQGIHSNTAVISFAMGFSLMMVLDVALG